MKRTELKYFLLAFVNTHTDRHSHTDTRTEKDMHTHIYARACVCVRGRESRIDKKRRVAVKGEENLKFSIDNISVLFRFIGVVQVLETSDCTHSPFYTGTE